jgi:hypothetical protein
MEMHLRKRHEAVPGQRAVFHGARGLAFEPLAVRDRSRNDIERERVKVHVMLVPSGADIRGRPACSLWLRAPLRANGRHR